MYVRFGIAAQARDASAVSKVLPSMLQVAAAWADVAAKVATRRAKILKRTILTG